MRRVIISLALAVLLVFSAAAMGSAQDTTPGEGAFATPEPTVTPAPTAEPTQVPTSEPTAEPTQIPTSEPTAEPTQTPTSEPTAEPTQAPTSEPTAAPTQIPTSEPTAEPETTPTAAPTATTVPDKAYFNHNGIYMTGHPNALVRWYVENGVGSVTIYLVSDEVFAITDLTQSQREIFTFALDRTVFPDTQKTAIVSDVSPAGEQAEGTFYVWIGTPDDAPTATPAPTSEPEATDEPTQQPTTEPTAAPVPAQSASPGTDRKPGMQAWIGGKGGFGGAAVVTRSVPHAASTVKNVVAYDGVELVFTGEDGADYALELGGELFDVSLELDGEAGAFTAELMEWNSERAGEPNALFFGAQDETASTFSWHFFGSDARRLAASGIEILVFYAGDRVSAISTGGCIAGPRYTDWRIQGIPSKEFAYTLRMADENTDLFVTVRGECVAAEKSRDAQLYYYDVYTGTLPMLNAPFGETANNQESGD